MKKKILLQGTNSQIYDYFHKHYGASECCLQDKQHEHSHKPHLHNALAEIWRKMNELKKYFHQASKHSMSSKNDLVPIGKTFHDNVKQHNRLRRKVLKRDRMKKAKFAIKQCTHTVWKFSEKLLSDDCQNDTQPRFHANVTLECFSKTFVTDDIDIFIHHHGC